MEVAVAVQHSNIADADRHEAKGASTATNGQVLKANGDGSTSFANPSTLRNITVSTTLEAQSVTDQAPSATDTPYQVTFGSGSSNIDATIASNGVITITNAGLYHLDITLNIGRATNTGTAIVVARLLVNDIQTGFSKAVKLISNSNAAPIEFSFDRVFAANDTVKVQIVRDSAGTNEGGLVTISPVVVGWADVPSASIRIQKIGGGF